MTPIRFHIFSEETTDVHSQFDVAFRKALPDTDPGYRTVDQSTALVTPFGTTVHFETKKWCTTRIVWSQISEELLKTDLNTNARISGFIHYMDFMHSVVNFVPCFPIARMKRRLIVSHIFVDKISWTITLFVFISIHGKCHWPTFLIVWWFFKSLSK